MAKIIKQHVGANGKIYNEYEPSEAWMAEWQKGYDDYNGHVNTGGLWDRFPYPVSFSGGYAEGVISARSKHYFK